jgi:D-serine deaminase-like pyridoxal phosphate-dependent protein
MLSIKKPTLVLNSTICKQNIRRMAQKAADAGVYFRPHFKTHQSATIGEWFRAEKVTGITVSSVTMAHYFASHGWTDITIAFPVNLHEIEEINHLAAAVKLNLLIESETTALFLSEKLTSECGFFIKIDTGYHRTGIEYSDISLIEIVLKAAKTSILTFKGFLVHNGNTYQSKNLSDIIQIQSFTCEKLLLLRNHFLSRYPDLILSVGDTPSCSQLPIGEGIGEIRPGNFVFYDVMQFVLGSCRLYDIAVALVCPVVAVHHNRNEAVIYCGAVHLSKDQTILPHDTYPVFGMVVSWNGLDWDTGKLLGKVTALSQEHGIVTLTKDGCNLKPGDLVTILPVHSCLTVHQQREYFTADGTRIETLLSNQCM